MIYVPVYKQNSYCKTELAKIQRINTYSYHLIYTTPLHGVILSKLVFMVQLQGM